MKLLLTNDDGVDVPGLEALLRAARTLGHDPVVIAPATHQSWCSHTITAHRGVRVEQRADHRFAVHGTPADCVRMGLLRLAPDAKWVLSGINHGANLGADVYYSGTVAAVREAVLHGWPGVALSHYRRRGVELDDWGHLRAGRSAGPANAARALLQRQFAAPGAERDEGAAGCLLPA